MEVDYSKPKIVCIDDFALKKRHTYGTILIDMETRKVIDLIESREVEVVTEWLKKFKNINFFNRDGSYTYAKAISKSHPNAVQISDYFHLVKNLCDYLKEYLIRKLPKLLEIDGFFHEGKISINQSLIKIKYQYENECELIERIKQMYADGNNYSSIGKIFNLQYRSIKRYLNTSQEEIQKTKVTLTEKQEKKQELIDKVKELHKKGFSKRLISRECKITFRTTNRYLNDDITTIRKNFKASNNNFFKFKSEIIHLLNEGLKKDEIYEIIKEKGYKYALRTFYRHILVIIKENANEITNKEKPTIKIKSNKIISLLYRTIDKISDFSIELYDKIIEKYTWIPTILNLIKEFKELVQNKSLNKFHTWMKKAYELDIKELNSFISGIKRDEKAVKNAITYRFTNGLAEGSVNKLKTLKRTMYGKASFETLKRKLLWCEYNK
ncbi:MAG: ISL3 family transposase [Clostridium sp.]